MAARSETTRRDVPDGEGHSLTKYSGRPYGTLHLEWPAPLFGELFLKEHPPVLANEEVPAHSRECNAPPEQRGGCLAVQGLLGLNGDKWDGVRPRQRKVGY